MEEYVQWFVEKVLQKEYQRNEEFDLWILQKESRKKLLDIKHIPHCYKEQMTIFDMVS